MWIADASLNFIKKKRLMACRIIVETLLSVMFYSSFKESASPHRPDEKILGVRKN
jgi:hypothetical protein